MDEAMNLDQDDASLVKWKESLGLTATGAGGDLIVSLHEFQVVFENHPSVTLALDGNLEEISASLRENPFVIKEGVDFTFHVKFSVSGDVAHGFKFINATYRMGMKVDTFDEMIGSFQPGDHEKAFPPSHMPIVAPRGMLGRGKYVARCRFTDDDDKDHGTFSYAFEVKREWE